MSRLIKRHVGESKVNGVADLPRDMLYVARIRAMTDKTAKSKRKGAKK